MEYASSLTASDHRRGEWISLLSLFPLSPPLSFCPPLPPVVLFFFPAEDLSLLSFLSWSSLFSISCELFGWLAIAKYQALEIIYRTYAGGVEGVVVEEKSVSWGGAQTKGEVHKHKITKNMFLHSDLLTSLISSLTQLCFTIRKLALRGNGLKR